MESEQATRRLSALVFGNEKVAKIVVLLDERLSAVTAQEVARSTGFGHSLVRDVLVKLVEIGIVVALPKVGSSSRSPQFYEKVPSHPLWLPMVSLARGLFQFTQTDIPTPDE